MTHDLNKLLEMNERLMQAMHQQSERHAKDVARLADKVEQNTNVVQQCLNDLVVFTTERANLVGCLADMKREAARQQDELNKLAIMTTRLDTRWKAGQYILFVTVSVLAAGGGVAAWLKFL